MPQYVARKPLTVLGEDYRPGQVVPMAELPERTRQLLIDQRRVEPDRIDVKKPAKGRRKG